MRLTHQVDKDKDKEMDQKKKVDCQRKFRGRKETVIKIAIS